MGAINSAALSLFLLLAPGFLATITFYSSGALSRFDHQHGILYDAAALVFISAVFHISALICFLIFGVVFFGDVMVSSMAEKIIEVGRLNNTSWIESKWVLCMILFYIIFITVAPIITSYLFIREIETGRFRVFRRIGRRFTHGVFYDLISGRKIPLGEEKLHQQKGKLSQDIDFITASIMVNIISSNRIIMYKGTVRDIIVGDKRQIESISIEFPRKFLIKIKDDTIEAQSQKYYRSVFSKDFEKSSIDQDDHEISNSEIIDASFLTIKGNQILNIAFQRVKMPDIMLDFERDESDKKFVSSLQ